MAEEMVRRNEAPIERLHSLLAYDAQSGALMWRKTRKLAGTADRDGYRCLFVDGTKFFAHRIAWAWHYGEWPRNDLDHIDGSRQNNAIANLRLSPSVRFNSQNRRKAMATNKLGILGVKAVGRKFQAFIDSRYIGTFESAQAAHEAYVSAKRLLHEACTL